MMREDVVGATVVCEVVGTALDVATTCYAVTEPESLIGVEITDFLGKSEKPNIGVFITCRSEGRKAFLTADQARELADILTCLSYRLDAGATSAQTS